MNRTIHPKEIEMLHRIRAEVETFRRIPSAVRVTVPPSRAGPSHRILLAGAMLALLFAATARGQTVKPQRTDLVAASPPRADSPTTHADTAASATAAAAAAAALPKWFDEIAVNAFVSTAYEYNGNRPTTGTSSYRVFDFIDNSFNLDVAELVVQIAPTKPNDAGFRVDFEQWQEGVATGFLNACRDDVSHDVVFLLRRNNVFKRNHKMGIVRKF